MKPIYTFLLALFSLPILLLALFSTTSCDAVLFVATKIPYPINLPAKPAPPNVIFILDASGSMWQKLDGEFKITTAKSVLKNLIGHLPAYSYVGLVAYGHKQKSDCNDIETIIPLGPLAKQAFLARLDSINPMGKTPIAKSISNALALIPSEWAPVTIVLISDGLETCEGNACDVVRIAKEQGVKITVHVVGFGIEEKDQSPLECIAQAGEGQYLSANNAGELNNALIKTVEAPPTAGGYLSVKVSQEGNLLDATVKVFKKGESKELLVGRTYTGDQTNPRTMLLPAGEYTASVTSVMMDGKPTQTLTDIRIVENDTLFKTVDFAQGTFEIRVTRNGALSDATIRIYKKGEKQTSAQGRSYHKADTNPAKYRILPGLYDIEIASVEIGTKPSVRYENQLLNGGVVATLSHNFESGELKIGAMQGSTLIDAVVQIYRNEKSVESGRTYASASTNPKSFILEPGKYKVELKPVGVNKDRNSKSLEVEIKTGDTISKTVEW